MTIPDKSEQHPQKEMNKKEYDLMKVEQFGELYPLISAHCKFCGKSYGKHYDLTCPITDETLFIVS